MSAAAVATAVFAATAFGSAEAELLALDEEHARVYRKWIPLRLEETDGDSGCDELLDKRIAIIERMIELPATTLRGSAAKSSVIFTECLDLEQCTQLWSWAERDMDWEVLIAWKFVSELRSAAGLRPSPMRNV